MIGSLVNHRRDKDPHPEFRKVLASELGAVDGNLAAHKLDHDNPHVVTAAQVGADPSGTAVSVVAAHVATYHPDHIDGGTFVGATFDRNADGGGF